MTKENATEKLPETQRSFLRGKIMLDNRRPVGSLQKRKVHRYFGGMIMCIF
jgi:hypothetical protein